MGSKQSRVELNFSLEAPLHDEELCPEIRIMVIGPVGAGKTSVLLRYFGGSFEDKCEKTEEADFSESMLHYNSKCIPVKITDIPGGLSYEFLKHHSSEYDGFVFVYSVDDKKSFVKLQGNILEFYNQERPAIIIGNKADLKKGKQISSDEGAAFASSVGLRYFEMSCKEVEDLTMKDAFDHLFESISRRSNKKISR